MYCLVGACNLLLSRVLGCNCSLPWFLGAQLLAFLSLDFGEWKCEWNLGLVSGSRTFLRYVTTKTWSTPFCVLQDWGPQDSQREWVDSFTSAHWLCIHVLHVLPQSTHHRFPTLKFGHTVELSSELWPNLAIGTKTNLQFGNWMLYNIGLIGYYFTSGKWNLDALRLFRPLYSLKEK